MCGGHLIRRRQGVHYWTPIKSNFGLRIIADSACAYGSSIAGYTPPPEGGRSHLPTTPCGAIATSSMCPDGHIARWTVTWYIGCTFIACHGRLTPTTCIDIQPQTLYVVCTGGRDHQNITMCTRTHLIVPSHVWRSPIGRKCEKRERRWCVTSVEMCGLSVRTLHVTCCT